MKRKILTPKKTGKITMSQARKAVKELRFENGSTIKFTDGEPLKGTGHGYMEKI